MKNIVNNMLHRLLEVYPEGEARALVRYVLEVRYNISIPDIYMGKDRHFPVNIQPRTANFLATRPTYRRSLIRFRA